MSCERCQQLEAEIDDLYDELDGDDISDLRTSIVRLEEDVSMLCARLGLTVHEWELERGSIRNQLLK